MCVSFLWPVTMAQLGLGLPVGQVSNAHKDSSIHAFPHLSTHFGTMSLLDLCPGHTCLTLQSLTSPGSQYSCQIHPSSGLQFISSLSPTLEIHHSSGQIVCLIGGLEGPPVGSPVPGSMLLMAGPMKLVGFPHALMQPHESGTSPFAPSALQ